VFKVLLEEQSVTKTAGRLGFTKPAVSRILARLRELFNNPLFTWPEPYTAGRKAISSVTVIGSRFIINHSI